MWEDERARAWTASDRSAVSQAASTVSTCQSHQERPGVEEGGPGPVVEAPQVRRGFTSTGRSRHGRGRRRRSGAVRAKAGVCRSGIGQGGIDGMIRWIRNSTGIYEVTSHFFVRTTPEQAQLGTSYSVREIVEQRAADAEPGLVEISMVPCRLVEGRRDIRGIGLDCIIGSGVGQLPPSWASSR